MAAAGCSDEADCPSARHATSREERMTMARGNGLQDLYAQVNAKRLMADVEATARWVRLSGTPGELQSFRYVQRQLRAAGCKTHLILHDAYISLPGPASLRVTPAGGETSLLACITHSFAASTSPDGLEAPPVLAARGPARSGSSSSTVTPFLPGG